LSAGIRIFFARSVRDKPPGVIPSIARTPRRSEVSAFDAAEFAGAGLVTGSALRASGDVSDAEGGRTGGTKSAGAFGRAALCGLTGGVGRSGVGVPERVDWVEEDVGEGAGRADDREECATARGLPVGADEVSGPEAARAARIPGTLSAPALVAERISDTGEAVRGARVW
jgi:hypothetical protein